ncbi:MAG: hypothetical protein LBJ00_16280 [Planctomycetaceae bacterium]|jgi:hypothetical protein|nr:hypothetical protein [Planctomycetaceae bacterium]
MKNKLHIVGCLAVLMGAFLLFNSTALAQISIRVGGHHGGGFQHHPPYYGHGYGHGHHHNDFDRTVHVLGAVGSIVAAANGYSPYDYYPRRPVVVVPPQPVVVTQPLSPMIVERPVVVEKKVIVERQVPVILPSNASQSTANDYYSSRLGATFLIQNMQIPGYTFKAARLTSDPVASSPLNAIGLTKGDVITRLDNESVDSVDVLDKHGASTVIRYIKTGTTKVLLGKIYIDQIPEVPNVDSERVYAP